MRYEEVLVLKSLWRFTNILAVITDTLMKLFSTTAISYEKNLVSENYSWVSIAKTSKMRSFDKVDSYSYSNILT